MVRNLQGSIALDTVRNEYLFHRQIHQWLAAQPLPPNLDTLNDRVYAELFLTPRSDPWLGLIPADTYTALENSGVGSEKKGNRGQGSGNRRARTPDHDSHRPGLTRIFVMILLDNRQPTTPVSMHILTIEDDAAIRRGIVDSLRFAGYAPLEAANGDVGLRMATLQSYDLLLLDLVLPGRDGLEILRAVRALRPTQPVIILTAPRRREKTAWPGCDWGPTIMWSSRSASRNCWPGSRRCCGARPSGRKT